MSTQIESVLLLDGVDQICSTKLKEAGFTVKTEGKLTKEKLIEELQNHDAVVVRSATKMTADVLEACTRLKVVGRAGTGVDNIDLEAATKKGILVLNTPNGNTLSAAEHTCALICALSRSITEACSSLKGGAWDRKFYLGNELGGKVLAIIGLGRIGKEVAFRMQSFGMRTIGYDPLVSKDDAAVFGIEFMDLDDLWPIADYITVHTPLIKQTKHLINEETFKKTKATVKVVNVARGGIIDENALLKALENGTCGGAALDVFETEPPTNLTLVKHPKVIATPHLGANTKEAQTRVAVDIADQFINMSIGKPLQGIVNAAVLTLAGIPEAKPWINLASSLASLVARVESTKEEPISIDITLKGEVCQWRSCMVPAVQKGFLASTRKEVNLVNAGVLAKDVGLNVLVHESSEESLKKDDSRIILTARFEGQSEIKLVGYVANGQPTLYSWNDSNWENGVSLKGNMTFIKRTSEDMKSLVFGDKTHSILSLLISSGDLVAVRTKQDSNLNCFKSVFAQLIQVCN